MTPSNSLKEIIEELLISNSNVLDLSDKDLKSLPKEVRSCCNIQSLVLDNNDIQELPLYISEFANLKSISMKNNNLTKIPYQFFEMTNLVSLDLSFNNITQLSSRIVSLINLESLIISDNNLVNLPENIGLLSSLTNLMIQNNALHNLPISIVNLSNLNYLDLSNNALNRIPSTLGSLSKLFSLNLSSNNLAVLDKHLFKVTSLEVLDVGGNKLKSIPDEIGKLKKLKKLSVSSNELAFLPPTINKLSKLIALDIRNNKLIKLPEDMSKLSSLRELLAQRNELVELPESLSNSRKLEMLLLDTNKFNIMPPCISNFVNLESLSFTSNKLTKLPDVFSNFKKLRRLYLDDNNIDEIPESIRDLKLEFIYLHGNQKLGLPSEVLGPSWTDVVTKEMSPAKPNEIFEYYLRVLGDKKPLNEAKLIFVGRGNVGKTSIINRLVHKKFNSTTKTEGINITNWNVVLNHAEKIRLNIWDFGGQEIMHATHQFFLTQRSLYVLVITGREGVEDADVEYWSKLIDSFGCGSPILVVLNKIKEHAFDVNRRALQQKYPIIKDFIKTDCRDGTGFDELKAAIFRETDRLEHLRDAFPSSWFAIKDKLASMRTNFLSFAKYRSLCKKLQEIDSFAQESLAFYLHSLGIVLNYREDPRLQDTHILNPHWVTNGIYSIINSDKLEQQKGEISLNDIRHILDVKKYPVQMHRFIIDLMRKFDLCFMLSEDDTYLIPELLDKQEPVEAANFIVGSCLNFQYHYNVLPEGVLPRFIVRTNILSQLTPRWRTGVILQFEGNSALIKADIQEKKVYISISGQPSGRRRLLAIIRADLERIHSDIKNLNPNAMVPLHGYPEQTISYKELTVMEIKGVKTGIKVVGDNVVNYDVGELLNGVDLEGSRRKERIMGERQPVRVFYSYSHKDEMLKNELNTHLKLLQRTNVIDAWHDRCIDAGEEWKNKIDDNLEAADIILLLISADFIASDYCYEREMKKAITMHNSGKAKVIPIIIRDVNWSAAPFAKLQALPKDALPVTKWTDKDSAWRNISEGIENVALKLRRV